MAVCAVCCPPLVLVPLGLLSGRSAGVTATTATPGAPVSSVIGLVLLTVGALTVWARCRLARRRTSTGLAPGPRHALTLTDASGKSATAPQPARPDAGVAP